MSTRKINRILSRFVHMVSIVALLTGLFTGLAYPVETVNAAASLSFATALNFNNALATNSIRTLAMADFNLDGNIDLAAANTGTDNVSVWFGDGTGNFGAAEVYASGWDQPVGLAAGDVDLDGDPDLVVSHPLSVNSKIGVLLSDGLLGTFSTRPPISIGPVGGGYGVAIADFNEDGLPDVATANNGGFNLLTGNGDGTFQPYTQINTISPPVTVDTYNLSVGDFNNDQHLDVAASHHTGGTVGVVLGNGDGSFAPPVVYPAGPSTTGTSYVTSGDFDNDNILDLATIVDSGFIHSLGILKGNGNGTFTPQTFILLGLGVLPRSISAADFDVDGNLDLAMAVGSSSFVRVYKGNGNLTFAAPLLFQTSGITPNLTSLALGKLNGDNMIDIAVSNYNANRISVLKNTGDTIPPVITAAVNPSANANGWWNTPVTATFSCTDNESGVASVSPPYTFQTDGANQSTTGTCSDVAGNISTNTVGGINLDTTAPVLVGAPTSAPNANGWYNGDVTIHWTCDGAVSGLDGACPADETITGEGDALQVTASIADLAGNLVSSASEVVMIDRTAPNTTVTAPGGWNNVSVDITFAANDALSGVAQTRFILDGGSTQSGSSLTISNQGIHTIQYWSEDLAGNVESAHTAQILIDLTSPTISHTQSPAANGNGWNNSNVIVSFICADNLSGIASCTPDQTVSAEGAEQPVPGIAVDNAGNTATDPATVSIDLTNPTIAAAADRSANAYGWYNAPVIVGYSCSDTLSGIDSCQATQTLVEGFGQSASGTAIDAAGNSSTASLSNINIDTTAPSLSGVLTSAPNGYGWFNTDVSVQWACGDVLSGILGGCPANSLVAGEGSNLSASESVSDHAGNLTSATVSGIKIDRTAPVLGFSASVGGNPYTPGTWTNGAVTVTFSCTDGLSGVSGFSSPVTFSTEGAGQSTTGTCSDNAGNTTTLIVNDINIDLGNPSISASSTPPANGNGWNNTDVTVAFACSDTRSGVDMSSLPADTTLTTDGAGQPVQGSCADLAGNVASLAVIVNIDKTPPTLNPVVSPATIPLNGSGTVTANGSDATSGVASESCGALDTTTAGTKTVTCTATDNAGNIASADASYTVTAGNSFNFTGFFQPVDNLPTVNQVNAGRGVPVKFSLGGDQGLNIFATGYPAVQPVSCSSGTPIDTIEITVAAGSSSLSYDPASDQYTYVWKTERAWAGSCAELIVRFTDGTQVSAQFKFK